MYHGTGTAFPPPPLRTQLAALRDQFSREIKAEQAEQMAVESAARSKQQASSSEPTPSGILLPGAGGVAAAPKLSMMKKLLARLEKGAAEVGVGGMCRHGCAGMSVPYVYAEDAEVGKKGGGGGGRGGVQAEAEGRSRGQKQRALWAKRAES